MIFLADIHPEHAHIIEQTKANMPSEEILEKTAEVFKVFGDKTRIRILAALSEGEMCVCCLCARAPFLTSFPFLNPQDL